MIQRKCDTCSGYWWQYCWQKKSEEIVPYWHKPHHKLHTVQVRTLSWEASLWQASFLLPTLWKSSTEQVKGKVHPRTGHRGPEGEQRYSFNLSLTSALDGGGWSTPRPNRFTSEKTRYPLYRRLGGPQDRSGWVQKISPPTGFDLRTVLPVGSCYTYYTIPVLGYTVHLMKKQSWNKFTLL